MSKELGNDLMTTQGPRSYMQAASENLRASVTVALVSVSLSIALGVASGATPVAGLGTAIWGGLSASTLGSSHHNIIGPAGALSGMLKGYTLSWTPAILPWISIFSSVLVALVYFLGIQRYLLFMPKAVFEGFTVSVAVIISGGQLNNAFGMVPQAVYMDFYDNFTTALGNLFAGNINPNCALLFIPMTIILLCLCRWYPKVPWMVVLPFSSIILGYCSMNGYIGWELPTLKTKYGVLDPMTLFNYADVNALYSLDPSQYSAFGVAVGSVAFVAVLETLISAKIGELRSGYVFDESIETRGLAMAHFLSGALGAMPCTGVFVRTAVNIDCGATHRIAQFMNAIVVMVITLVLLPVFEYMPLPAIAALLWAASLRMVPKHYLFILWEKDRPNLYLCLIVAAICVVFDPVQGMLFGTLVSFLRHAMETMNNHFAVDVSTKANAHATVTVRGPLSFMNADRLTQTNSKFAAEKVSKVTVDLENCTSVDLDAIDALTILAKGKDGERDVDINFKGSTYNSAAFKDKILEKFNFNSGSNYGTMLA
jgi:SulP family sulfate permease